MSKHNKWVVVFLLPVWILIACQGEKKKQWTIDNGQLTVNSSGQLAVDSSLMPVIECAGSDRPHQQKEGFLQSNCQLSTVNCQLRSATALRFDSLGLVNIADLDSSIAVSLLYATPDNFVGEIMYDDLTEAYLHPEAAEALLKAQRLLKESHPDYTLIIYDATRPMSAQRKMWDLVKGTPKNIYVSNPSRGGGLHNYGLAVDISILGADGTPLDMGTEVDHLGIEAHTTNEAGLVKNGIITQQAKENRELLRKVMRGAGFRALNSEWWHFNLYSREVAKKNYKLVE